MAAIVVTEYADRKISEGLVEKKHIRLSSKRMFFPIIASTATTIAAFTPLIFWPGFTGQFMRFLPITVFIVSICITRLCFNYYASYWLYIWAKKINTWFQVKVSKLEKYSLIKYPVSTARMLRKFVRNPGETIIAVLMLLWFFGYGMYGNFNKGTLYFADVDPVAAEISIRARGNFLID